MEWPKARATVPNRNQIELPVVEGGAGRLEYRWHIPPAQDHAQRPGIGDARREDGRAKPSWRTGQDAQGGRRCGSIEQYPHVQGK